MSEQFRPLSYNEIEALFSKFDEAQRTGNSAEMRRIFWEMALGHHAANEQLQRANYNLEQIKARAYPTDPDATFQFDPVINRLMMGRRFEEAIVERSLAFVRSTRRER